MEVIRDAADDRTPAANGELAAAFAMGGARRDRSRAPRAANALAAAAGNLIDRRGVALALPILPDGSCARSPESTTSGLASMSSSGIRATDRFMARSMAVRARSPVTGTCTCLQGSQ